jgi:hypothetical protein
VHALAAVVVDSVAERAGRVGRGGCGGCFLVGGKAGVDHVKVGGEMLDGWWRMGGVYGICCVMGREGSGNAMR